MIKKILIISNSSWNLYNFRLPLIKSLCEEGHKIFCMASEDAYTQKIKKISLINFVDLNYLNPRGQNPFKEILLLLELFQKIRKIQPDLVISFTIKINIYSGIICRLLGTSYINNITGLGSEYKDGKGFSKFLTFLLRYALTKSKIVIFHNDEDRRALINDEIVLEDKTLLIPGSGIDELRFQSQRKIKEVNNFLFLGRWLREKGILEFIEASKELAKENSQLKFILVGDFYGVLDNEIKTAIDSIKENSSFKIHTFTEEVIPFFEEADCFVLPSTREGLSKSLMEAMSMERIAIASDVPGCRELIDNGKNGFLLPSIKSKELYHKMKFVSALDKMQLISITQNARVSIEKNFTTTQIVNQYKKLINKLLNL